MVQRKKVSDLLGREFHRYKVIGYLGKGKHGKHYWKLLCKCGVEFSLNTSLITGNSPTRSCGCLRRETMAVNRADPHKHGLHDTKLYAIYHGMRQRCYNPRSQRYKYYGRKGVKVCEEWLYSVEEFCLWASGNGYSEGLSIDRIDPEGNYEPGNCEWVSVTENSRRMNDSRRVKEPAA